MKYFKLFISAVVFVLWLVVSLIAGVFAVLTILPLAILVAFPEFVVLWCMVGIAILVFGGWINEMPIDIVTHSEEGGGKDASIGLHH